MSLDPATAIEVAEDVAHDAKNPVAVIADALTLYRVSRAIPATGSIGAKVATLDKEGLLEKGIDALAELLPLVQQILKTPAQKTRLLAVLMAL